jgi:regulator of RNase E activity RraA/CMP-N-acetylneuraminic acid synthetase
MRVAAFLPAKGSSNRIPNKNTMLLDGEPLFLRSLRKLTQCPSIDEVYLDTESVEIARLAAEVRCRHLQRPVELASNATDGHRLFCYEAEQTDADVCVQLLCTSPFISIATIEKAIAVLRDDATYDSVVAVHREKQYTWRDGRPGYDADRIPNSADLPDTVLEAMSLYVVRREAALRLRRRIGERPFLLDIDPLESVDVNWPKDFELANLIAVGLREQERRFYAVLRSVLSSPLLSDVLDELGVSGVLAGGFTANLPAAKILGRAKTVQLDVCTDDDDYRKIYDTLTLYDHVVPDDIIVVSNRVPDSAFFGELNARLALRAGAAGAIIDGVTRDSRETADLGFPVFSKGRRCRDARRRGVMTFKNRTVVIDGVNVHKDDLIFADVDGIVVVPGHVERTVIDRALGAVRTEREIVADIAAGVETAALVQRHGLF